MTLSGRDALWALAILIALFGEQRCAAKREGVLQERLKGQEVQHHADSIASLKAVELAQRVTQKADSLRRQARLEVRKDSLQQAHTDSIVRQSANERERALAVLQDSLATTTLLRETVTRVVEASRRDSVSFMESRTQSERTIRSLMGTLAADSTAIQKGIDATNQALRRATSSEAEVQTLRKMRPSTVGSVLKYAGVAAAAFYIGKGMR